MKPMQYSLALDHFYIDINNDEFEELKGIIPLFNWSRTSVVNTDNDSWEGIYIYSRIGPYFEILRARRNGGLGICLSPSPVDRADARDIKKHFPNLDWQQDTRSINGVPWYTWLSTGNYLDTKNTFFNAWVMHYHPQPTSDEYFKKRPKLATIDRFESIHLTIGRDNLAEILRLSEWIPCDIVQSENQIIFEIPDKDCDHFKILIDLVDGHERFKFKQLKFNYNRNTQHQDISLKNFEVIEDGEFGVLKRMFL